MLLQRHVIWATAAFGGCVAHKVAHTVPPNDDIGPAAGTGKTKLENTKKPLLQGDFEYMCLLP